MPSCLIGLGSNLGDRAAMLRLAVEQLRRVSGVTVSAVSSWYETHPIGGAPGQGRYLNGALRAESSLSPPDLLRTLQEIERRLGRGPHERWDARLVDLDLLLYGDWVLQTSSLQLPHPWMAIRRFVLAPSSEIAPTMVHPTIGWTVKRLLEHLSSAPPYIAVTGVPGSGKSRLVRAVHSTHSWQAMDGGLRAELAGAAGADSPGLAWDTEIQFLRYRICVLDQYWKSPSRGRAISDFWLRQSLAFARLHLTEPEYKKLRAVASHECAGVEPPRLRVLLQAPPEWYRGPLGEHEPSGGERPSHEQVARLHRYLDQEVSRPGQGPFLRLDARDYQRAVSDVVAAMEAMASECHRPQTSG